MIGALRGTVESVSGRTVILEVHGVGYEVVVSSRLLDTIEVGSEIKVVIFTHVAQDILKLYGFIDQIEKQTFLLLTRVKGVGPKSAAEIVSRIHCTELLRIVGAGDVARLQGVKGVGKKTAERIVVELRDKVGAYVVEQSETLSDRVERQISPTEEAVEALQALGFIRKDAERAVRDAIGSGIAASLGTGVLVKEALRFV